MTHQSKKLTPNQTLVLNALVDWAGVTGGSPTCRELGRSLNLSHAYVHRVLCDLERNGHIVREHYKHRSIRVVTSEDAP